MRLFNHFCTGHFRAVSLQGAAKFTKRGHELCFLMMAAVVIFMKLYEPFCPLEQDNTPAAQSTIDTRAPGRELDEITSSEVAQAGRAAALRGLSGPSSCEDMNLQLYHQTVMFRQNQHGEEMK